MNSVQNPGWLMIARGLLSNRLGIILIHFGKAYYEAVSLNNISGCNTQRLSKLIMMMAVLLAIYPVSGGNLSSLR